MLVSAVIPTLNRPQAIIDIAKDFLAQEFSDLEVIVVDQTDRPNQALADLARQDSRLQVLRTDIPGTCHARNMGVSRASGEIIIFTDDDCRLPDQSFVTAHVRNYGDPKIGGVGGRVIDTNQRLNKEQSGRVCWVTPSGRIYGNASSVERQDINAPRGGNMSYRRHVILDVGGFDEHFRGNAMREETDFSLRVVRAGWRIVFDPAAPAQHLGLPGGSRSRDRITWYEDFFFNESYFFLKHFRRRYLPLLLGRKTRAILACALYYGRLRPRALTTPWRAFGQAWRLVHENR